MQQYNWGIIAPGQIANSFATALRGVNRASLYSVASRDQAKATRFANQYGFTKTAQSYEHLINDPKVDVIYIASPHHLHAEQSIACLNAGKAVLCEKPMTVNAADAKRVFAAASQNGTFYMEALWTRFLPVYQQIRTWLDEDKIGEVQLIQASFGIAFPFDPESRLYNPDFAGGALLDMGIYPITFAQWVTKATPKNVTANGCLGKSGVDESTAITLSYAAKSGCDVLASLATSTNASTNYDAWIVGTKGRIKVPLFWCAETASLFANTDSLIPKDDTPVETISAPHTINGYEGEIIETMRCLDQGLTESPTMPWSESLSVMEIMDEVRAQIGLTYPFEN